MAPRRFPSYAFLLGLSCLLAAGCASRDNSSSSPPRKATGSPQTAPAGQTGGAVAPANEEGGSAVLEGRVVFQGAVPPPRKISVTKDVEYCGKFAGEQQPLLVSETGGLANVVIEIRGASEPQDGWKWQAPQDGYVLRQKGCAFAPPLLVMPDGEQLKVYNDDPVAHNINTGQWNVMQAGGGEATEQKLTGKQPVRVVCNIHSWMESWIYLVQSPLYAVTDEKGAFRIPGVPPGAHRVSAWHSSLRRQRVTVEFPAGKTVNQEFVFESPFSD